MVVQSAYLKDMFGILDIVSTGTFVCLSNFQFVVEVSAQPVMSSSKSKYDDLFVASQLILWVFLIIVGMLFCPFILYFSLDECFSSLYVVDASVYSDLDASLARVSALSLPWYP